MINAILNGFLKLVVSIFNAILSPVIGAITALFPSVGSLFGYVTTFLGYGFTYVSLIIDLLFIPRQCFVLFFDYLIVCYSIYLISISAKFIVNVYNKFKL